MVECQPLPRASLTHAAAAAAAVRFFLAASQGLVDISRHVIQRIVNPLFLTSTAPYAVAGNICRKAHCPPRHRHAF